MIRTTLLAAALLAAASTGAVPPAPITVLGSPGMRHAGSIQFVAFSPDGQTMATGGLDKVVRLWSVATGKERRRFTDLADRPTQVAFSADGRCVFTANGRGGVQWWEVATGRQRLSAGDRLSWRPPVVFSPDGKVAASRVGGMGDRRIRLTNVETGEALHELDGHRGDPTLYAFSPDSKLLVSAARDETVRLWDVAKGKEVAQWKGHDHAATTLTFAPDGKHLATSGNGSVRVWDLTGKNAASHSFYPISGRMVSFHPNGRRLAMGSAVALTVWDWTTDKVVATWKAPPGLLSTLAYSPDGKSLVAAVNNGPIEFLDAETGTPRAGPTASSHARQVTAIRWRAGGKELVTIGADETARVWDVASGKSLRVLDGMAGKGVAVAASPDGKLIAAATADGKVGVWAASTGERLWDVETDGERGLPGGVSFSPDGKLLAVSTPTGPIRLIDVTSREEARRVTGAKAAPHPLAFSPDGRHLVGVSREATEMPLLMWDLTPGAKMRRVTAPGLYPVGALFTPDSRMMLVRASQTLLIEMATGQHRFTLGFPGPATISPEGRYVVAGGGGHTVEVWDLALAARLNHWEHPGRVSAVAWSPDGRSLAVGGEDGVTRVWERRDVLPPRPEPKLTKLAEGTLDKLWVELGMFEGNRSFAAMRNLSLRPGEALPMLRERAAAMVTGKQIEAWIAELDHDDIKVRDRADEMLSRQKGLAAVAMYKALEGLISPERRRRLKALLDKLEGAKVDVKSSGELELRASRAVELLERMATPEAQALLKEWAEGKGAAVLIAEAKAALARAARTP